MPLEEGYGAVSSSTLLLRMGRTTSQAQNPLRGDGAKNSQQQISPNSLLFQDTAIL